MQRLYRRVADWLYKRGCTPAASDDPIATAKEIGRQTAESFKFWDKNLTPTERSMRVANAGFALFGGLAAFAKGKKFLTDRQLKVELKKQYGLSEADASRIIFGTRKNLAIHNRTADGRVIGTTRNVWEMFNDRRIKENTNFFGEYEFRSRRPAAKNEGGHSNSHDSKRNSAIPEEERAQLKHFSTRDVFGDGDGVPDEPLSRFGSEASVFKPAKTERKAFVNVMQELGRKLRMNTADVDSPSYKMILEHELSEPGPFIELGPIKRVDRSNEKVAGELEGNWRLLDDVIRGTVWVEHPGEMQKTLRAIRDEMQAHGYRLARGPRNRFESPTPTGYRDIQLHFNSPDGHTIELQVNLKGFYHLKQKTHKPYEELRSIKALAEIEKRTLTTKEKRRANALIKEIRDEYDREWRRLIHGPRS